MPPRPGEPTFHAELLRPDDLLHLRISAVNLRVAAEVNDLAGENQLDDAVNRSPVLVVTDRNLPAYLTVTFPPQTIAESAFFEAAIVPGGTQPIQTDPIPNRNDADTSSKAIDPLPSPGHLAANAVAVAELGGRTRLVFKVPADAAIPFSVKGLLDWSELELKVNGIAAIDETPTADEIANAPAIKKPGPLETAIELPYRLVISPTAAVAWLHRSKPFTARGRTELWHTRLALKNDDDITELSRSNLAPLRAIWSPDYRAEVRGVDKDPDLGRVAMSPDDRYQIVVLTSAFHGYEVELKVRRRRGKGPAGPSTRIVPYVPEPFMADLLMLSSLGGWLRSRGQWTPPRPVPARRRHRELSNIFKELLIIQDQHARGGPNEESRAAALAVENFVSIPAPQDPLDLSEWVHLATQGRDHYVKIVYEGELWPFRHPAALIKVTERKFKENNGLIVAYLMQRMFIIVRKPVMDFTKADRGNPYKRVRLTTLVTPDIADPSILADPANPAMKTHRSFWVEVMTSTTSRTLFRFHGVGTDVAGEETDFTKPLMFVSRSDVASSAALTIVAKSYNDAGRIEDRSLKVDGQHIAYAEHDVAKPNDNTRLVTESLNFVVDAAGNPPQMLKATVKIPQVQELLGKDTATTIRFLKSYVQGGFDAVTGTFAEIVKQDLSLYKPLDPFAGMVADKLGVDFSADKAGGFATPNLGVSTLTRALGPMAGTAAEAVAGNFNPASFFPDDAMKIFGSFDLKKLLPAASLDQNAPKMVTETQNAPDGKLLVTRLHWEPKVQNLDLGIAAFEKDYKNKVTKLVIDGLIEKPLKVANLAAPVTDDVKSEFTGTLNDFTVSVLKSVFINFTEFSFAARAKQKPDVKVKLDPGMPLKFGGDLAFVEEIRNAIPPGLFGDGPSLDLISNPLGIRAGFAFALPPLTVGVFTLKDVKLGAGLTLPFLDGKPVFDFNISERAHPFLLAVSIFGGGGFFHLQLDTAGMKALEIALEFGAMAALDIGVASGEVHIMAGIYFSLQRKEGTTDLAAILTGYLRVGGSLNVLGLVHISVEFNLSFTYDSGRDKAYGRATLTVSVEVLFFSASVELTVERAFGGSGDPHFLDFYPDPEPWRQYALAFA